MIKNIIEKEAQGAQIRSRYIHYTLHEKGTKYFHDLGRSNGNNR